MFYSLPISACRRILLILLLLAFSGNLQGAESRTALLSDLDLPLMPGFREDADSRVVFDTPAGRIIEVSARGNLPPRQVFDYYQLVLPSLSWRKATPAKGCDGPAPLCLVAVRDGEVLKIIIRQIKDKKTGNETETTIYFSVNPE